MVFELKRRWLDARRSNELLQLRPLHVGYANMSHAAILLRVEQALPNLDRLIGADRPQPVNQHKVNVIDAELFYRRTNRLVRGFPCADGFRVDLARDPKLIARHAALFNGHRQVLVIAIHLRCVDEPAALRQILFRRFDQRRSFGSGPAACSIAEQRHWLRCVAIEDEL